MAWRLADSLDQLRAQINAAYPNRSKVSDGTIGDAAHAARASDHNPNALGVVCAIDITNDPANGLDIHAVAERIRTNRHPNLKYIVSNKRIAGAWTGWNWASYPYSNPHEKHVHFSVGVGSDGQSKQPYDDRTNWNIKGGTAVDDAIIRDAPNWYSRCNKTIKFTRGRDMSRDEFLKQVGRRFINFVEDAEDAPEADAQLRRIQIGWDNTITDTTEWYNRLDKLFVVARGRHMYGREEFKLQFNNSYVRAVSDIFSGTEYQAHQAKLLAMAQTNNQLTAQNSALITENANLKQQILNGAGPGISQETINTINETNAVVKVIKGTTDWIKDKVEAIIRAFSTGN